MIADAQVVENGIIEVREDPDLGPVRQPRPAARFTETPAEIRSIAPWLGADNVAILEEPRLRRSRYRTGSPKTGWCIGGSRGPSRSVRRRSFYAGRLARGRWRGGILARVWTSGPPDSGMENP